MEAKRNKTEKEQWHCQRQPGNPFTSEEYAAAEVVRERAGNAVQID